MANTSTKSVSITVNLTSANPPSVSISQPASGSLVNTNPPVIKGTASAGSLALARVEVSIDGGSYVSANGTTSWTYTPPSALSSQASHTVNARAVDTSGNFSSVATVTFTIDNTGPVITISSPSNGAVFNTAPGQSTVNITVSGSATDPAGIQSVEVSVDAGTFTAASGTTSWSKVVTVGGGSHTITVRATDIGGVQSLYTISLEVGNEAGNIAFLPILFGIGAAVLVFTTQGKDILRKVGIKL